ncbi:Asparagine_synthase [Hexamita inflata]|uniref:Asparagine synthase n=1 Tax=Hexamita inflata TaxID=28002 RepID=A0AA86PP61_9EUKA|nr:Asparagine synthase [Hexamita inflata]
MKFTLTLSPFSVECDSFVTKQSDSYLISAQYTNKDFNQLTYQQMLSELSSFTFVQITDVIKVFTDCHGQIPIQFTPSGFNMNNSGSQVLPGVTTFSFTNNELVFVNYVQFQHVFNQIATDSLTNELKLELQKIPEKPLIMLSGGVDSTLLFLCMLEIQIEFDAVTVSFVNVSPDQITVDQILEETTVLLEQKGLKKMFTHTKILVTEEAYKQQINQFKKQFENLTVMDLNLLSVWHFATHQYNNKYIISGLGPDEYLGGYKKIKGCSNQNEIKALIQKQIEQTHNKNIIRDFKFANSSNKILIYPYLAYNVTQIFQKLIETDMEEIKNKKPVRDPIFTFGYNEQIFNRDKRAAQFGSGAAKIIKSGGYDFV